MILRFVRRSGIAAYQGWLVVTVQKRGASHQNRIAFHFSKRGAINDIDLTWVPVNN